jgi:peptide/nickel transport system substrate-binding protein
MWKLNKAVPLAAAVLLAVLLALLLPATPASAQKYGGVLRALLRDTLADLSLHEAASVETPFAICPVYSNLVVFDHFQPVDSPDTIRPELAESWSWSEQGRVLTFTLRQGVTWHDGKPFTAADVKETFDIVRGAKRAGMKLNPRKTWYANVREIVTRGEREVTFRLNRAQPSLLSMLAGGFSAVYPAHVTPAELRNRAVGTGPFRLKTHIPDRHIVHERNPAYFVKGRPYLDGVDFAIIKGASAQAAAFIGNQLDIGPPPYTLKPVADQLRLANPALAFIERVSAGTGNLIVNTRKPPFSNIRVRQAVNLSLDRASLIKAVYRGGAVRGSAMIPQPWGRWGLSPAQIETLPGYGDPEKNKAEARKLLLAEGYGPDNPLKIVISSRAVQSYIEPSIWMIGELKTVGIEATLEQVELGTWYAKIARRDYQIASNQTSVSIDDPDAQLFENFTCGSSRNYSDYCNPALEKKYEQQSIEPDYSARLKLVNEIDIQLQHEVARPYLVYRIYHHAHQRAVKDFVPHVISASGWRFAEVWLDK